MNRSILPTLLVILAKCSDLVFANTFEDIPNYDLQVAPDHGEGDFGSWLYGEDNKPDKASYSRKEDRLWQQNYGRDPQEGEHVKIAARHGRMYAGKNRKYLKYISAAEDTDDQTTTPKEDRLVESLAFVSIWTRILNWLSCITGFGCEADDSATLT